jgi:uncharacterized iron-regulated membrane protein
MIRVLLLLHRYLGIAVGALMVMWCVSGVVMMYVSYPELGETARLRHLPPIDWNRCCKIGAEALAEPLAAGDISIQMLGDRPVLQTRMQRRPIDLSKGSPVERISPEEAAAVARRFEQEGTSAAPRLDAVIDYDAWTVSGDFAADRPLYRFELGDGARTVVYVSGTTGRAVQATTGRQRFWNWLGSIPHWLYFTELRHRTGLWTQVVIAASLTGVFLAATGIYIGLRQFLHRPAGRWLPYRGFNLWHHIAGLLAGIFALTWVLSGLLSMNPWGWLEGAGAGPERAQLRGMSQLSADQLRSALQAVAAAHPPAASLSMIPLDGRMYFIATESSGERRRLDDRGMPAPFKVADLAYVARILGGASALVPGLMTQEDAYYFSHHEERVQLPIYRLISPDGSATRYYIDPLSGALVAKFDRGARAYRWWHEGLHRLDFAAPLRGRPQWDVLLLLLLSGVTASCVTGTCLGWRRLLGNREVRSM